MKIDEKQILEDVLNGSFQFRRFTRKEQGGSSDAADRFLWLALLRAELELAGAECPGICSSQSGTTGSPYAPCRFLTAISEPLPPTFEDLADLTGRFRDRGQESVVFDGGDGFVYKIRKMRSSVLSGYIAPLSSIVYHNALFPCDRYVLESIYSCENAFYMVLRQPRVEILLTETGYPIQPTADQIREAIVDLHNGLVEYEHEDDDEDADDNSSSSSSGESGADLKFFNSDYYVSDLQPGRDTVIDVETGTVRFIDPRISLNDPDGPMTPVSRLGCRHERIPPMSIAEFS